MHLQLCFEALRSPRILCAMLSLLVLGTSNGCVMNPKATPPPGPAPSAEAKNMTIFYKKGGWIPLEEPDSRFEPGTIFLAEPGKYPHWLSTLESCGVPKEELGVASNDVGDFKYTGTSTFNPKVVLTIKGVSPSGDFKLAKTATWQQSDFGASSVDVVKATSWIFKPDNKPKFNPVCDSYLKQPNVYITGEAYRVGQGSYTLNDEKGGALSLLGLKFSIVNVSVNADAKITGDSSLTLKVPVYTAVRKAIFAGDLLRVLGPESSTSMYSDEKIIKNLP